MLRIFFYSYSKFGCDVCKPRHKAHPSFDASRGVHVSPSRQRGLCAVALTFSGVINVPIDVSAHAR